jgi:serine/threonine protein kinase
MESSRSCRHCGNGIASDAPFGHCPQCLIEEGFLAPKAPEPPKPRLLPRQFGDFELGEQIGRGGMGVVYKAWETSLDRWVAMKMVQDSYLASPVAVRRFLIEAEAAARLEHPNIVRIYQIDEVDGQHFFTMRLIEGEGLDRKIALGEFRVRKGKRRVLERDKTQERIATLLSTVARAVHYAHGRGVLHRDLKPGNILIDRQGQPHLTDFGLAKISEGAAAALKVTQKTVIIGTPGYMPPEQASGLECTGASDIFSLGAILYEMLTGTAPFDGATPLEILHKTILEDPRHPRQTNPAIDPDLAIICLKCLEKNPAQRYVSALALAEDLERWLRREPIKARRASVLRRVARWVQRNRAGAALIVSMFIGLLLTSLALNHAQRSRASKDLALAGFSRAISRQIDNLGSTNAFYEITSEQFGYLHGKEPQKLRARPKRLSVGVFIFNSPLDTVLGYGALFSTLEGPLASEIKQTVRIDFRVYTDVHQAIGHLLAGRIDFLRVDPMSAASIAPTGKVRLLAQDQAQGDVGVIFSRAGSGITNIAQLKGQSLAFFDTKSAVTVAAKEALFNRGLCARDLACNYVSALVDADLARPGYFESPEQGYFDRQCETVRQVIDFTNYVAGIARVSQFRRDYTNEWNALATFPFERHVWASSTNVSQIVADAFKKSLLIHKPKETARSYAFGAGYEVPRMRVQSDFTNHMANTLTAAALFDHCPEPATTNLSGFSPKQSYEAP